MGGSIWGHGKRAAGEWDGRRLGGFVRGCGAESRAGL